MLTPTKVSAKESCVKRLNSILHPYSKSNTEEQANSQITDLTKSSFNSSTDHRIVYKNFNYKTPYDAWIYEGNETNKIVGYKYLQSYPYDEPKFKIGDYVHWNYNHKEFSTWILISLDTEYLYNVKGRMLLCNNSLRWKDKNTGEINCYPCVIEDSMTYTNFKWGNRGVVEPSGDIIVVVQRNEYTSQISINDRFLFDGVGFKVKQFLNELNPNYLELYMMKTPELDGDDLNDNIAINDRQEEKEILHNVVVSPNISKINQGETIQFSVYNYINEVKQSDEFSVEIQNVPKEYYELNIIDGNNFEIKNVKEYQINPMTVECKDTVTGDSFQKNIWLGGNW